MRPLITRRDLPRCNECIFYDPAPGKESEGFLGLCRRHAPDPATRENFSASWPAVYRRDWCGDGSSGR